MQPAHLGNGAERAAAGERSINHTRGKLVVENFKGRQQRLLLALLEGRLGVGICEVWQELKSDGHQSGRPNP